MIDMVSGGSKHPYFVCTWSRVVHFAHMIRDLIVICLGRVDKSISPVVKGNSKRPLLNGELLATTSRAFSLCSDDSLLVSFLTISPTGFHVVKRTCPNSYQNILIMTCCATFDVPLFPFHSWSGGAWPRAMLKAMVLLAFTLWQPTQYLELPSRWVRATRKGQIKKKK